MTGTEAPPPAPRLVTLEDVHKLIGALTLELDLLRRENAALRVQLTTGPPAGASR